jgi:hypothetical protein
MSINSLIVKDSVSKQDTSSLSKEIKDFIGNGAKNVSVIIIKEN